MFKKLLLFAMLMVLGASGAKAILLTPWGGGSSGGVVIAAIQVNYAPNGNYLSGTGVWTPGNIFYFDGANCNNSTIGTLSVNSGSGAFTGTFSVSGPNGANFQVTGNNLQCAGTLTAGQVYNITIVATQSGAIGSPFMQSVTAYAGQQYFMSASGSDGNNGLSAGAPWATANHAVNCGDFLSAASGTYGNMTTFGVVTCQGNDNEAWVVCATAFACSIPATSGAAAVALNVNYWGIQGFIISDSAGAAVLSQPPNNLANIQRLAIANNVIQASLNGGIEFALDATNQTTGADYNFVVGNMVFNTVQSTGTCTSGILDTPGVVDTAGTVHRYYAWNVMYGNVDGAGCAGGGATNEGHGLDFDNLSQDSFGTPAVALFENNIAFSNGAKGMDFDQTASGSRSPGIVVRNNTVAGNFTDQHLGIFGSQYWDISFSESSNNLTNIRAVDDLSSDYITQVSSSPVYGMGEEDINASASMIDEDWLYGFGTSGSMINVNTGYKCLGGGSVATPSPTSYVTCPLSSSTVDPDFAGAAYFTGSVSGTTLTTSAATGAAIAGGLNVMGLNGTQLIAGTQIVSGSGTTWTLSKNNGTIGAENMIGLPAFSTPSCSGQSDVVACAASMGITSAYTPQAPATTPFGWLNIPMPDVFNTTVWICNSERALPANLDPNC